MKTTYELWDTESSNLVGTYPTEQAALAVVRNAVKQHGPEAFETIVPSQETEQDDVMLVASGNALVQLAMRTRQSVATV